MDTQVFSSLVYLGFAFLVYFTYLIYNALNRIESKLSLLDKYLKRELKE